MGKKRAICVLLLLFAPILLVCSLQEAGARMASFAEQLPAKTGVWTRSDTVRVIDAETIFDYMNGAGELYVGYRFDRLEVFEYTAADRPLILVELYFMETSDDAFGLLSLDWGGEPVVLAGSGTCWARSTDGGARGRETGDAAEDDVRLSGSAGGATEDWMVVPQSRALYGAGLLRIWTADIYARVFTERETPVSREAVLEIGRAIAAGRDLPPQPELLEMLEPTLVTDWRLKKSDIRYLRSYLVLNSSYYLSNENILDLGHETEAVTAPYVREGTDGGGRIRLLVVKYPDRVRAAQAFISFHESYLDEHEAAAEETGSCFEIEDGWVGYALVDAYGALVFECPDGESCRGIMEEIRSNLREKEGDHGG